MFKIQKTKKQTEELNSSKIKEALVSYMQVYRSIETDLEEGVYTPFEAHVLFNRLITEISEILAGSCSVPDDNEPTSDFFDVDSFFVQSGEGVDMTATWEEGATQEQNVGFTDMENNVIADIPHPMEYTKVDKSQNVELGDFLKRPVKIYSKSWTIGTTIDAASTTFDPWLSFFSHPSIKKKLDNYYMVRCNLHLKFVINASPFYYGCCIAAYQPLTIFNPAPVVLSASNRLENVSYSQRPHIYLYPQDSQGGEMVLPFLYHKNWLNATSSAHLSAMGQMTLNSFGTLKNANGLTSDSLNIKVYAWADGIEVAGPTSKLAVQSGDEYCRGVVSRPASAIARAAGMLSDVPIIGEFATATSYAAGAIADIASLFGYTNVPVIEDVKPFYSKPFPNLCATDIGTPVEKLTLDAKNELSIDPKITGVDVDDELTIKSFVTRESFIHESVWSASDAAETGLFYAKVSPMMLRTEAVTNAKVFWGTPMSHLGLNFKWWRGDIIFRFKFICTKYHRGRVVVNWDPIGNIGTIGDYTTETYTRIVDITQETDVEFRVPYTQLTSYLRCSSGIGETTAKDSTSVASVGDLYNGIITLRVLNEQTSPVTSADIQVLAFVRGADNLEFAAPRQVSNLISPYVVQSGVMDVDPGSYNIGVKDSVPDPNLNLIHMGEHCVSLRQLMRRSTQYVRLDTSVTGGTNNLYAMLRNLSRSPLYPGFDINGLHGATGLTVAVAKNYNWVNWNPATFFSTCFVASRGSYIYNLNVSGRDPAASARILRTEYPHTKANYSVNTTFASGSTPGLVGSYAYSADKPSGITGQAVTSQLTQAGVSALVPMYSRYKFLSNNISTRTAGTQADDSHIDTVTFSTMTSTTAASDIDVWYADTYVGIGTDFNLVFFLNVPAMWEYASFPTAVAAP
jgi:hypothetical protein